MRFLFLATVATAAATALAQDGQPGGRFVQFSKAAKGSGGEVAIAAACFVPGPANERVQAAAFLSDGGVLAAVETGGSRWELIRFAPGLKSVTSRLPLDDLGVRQIVVSDKLVAVSGTSAAASGERGVDGRVRLVDEAASGFRHSVRFPGRAVDISLRTDSEILAENGRDTWIVTADGEKRDGPAVPDSIRYRERARLVSDPRDGSFYLGGEIHSPTGLEPWRSPLLHKFDAEGRPVWTAWNWTGPIVGTERFRLVSDSAVRQMRLGAGGDLIVGGWSDGGNSVFFRQPYDLTEARPSSRFGDSVWGAGVLSVAHIMRLDTETMELKAGTTFLAYHAFVNKPGSARLSDLHQLPDGRVVFCGGSGYGLIETPDAWVRAWSVEHAEAPETARVKGGPFFAMLSPDFDELLFSSVVPGARDTRLAVRGDQVLLYGAAASRESAYGMDEPTRLANPPEGFGTYGGGDTDGYLMLIDAGGAP